MVLPATQPEIAQAATIATIMALIIPPSDYSNGRRPPRLAPIVVVIVRPTASHGNEADASGQQAAGNQNRNDQLTHDNSPSSNSLPQRTNVDTWGSLVCAERCTLVHASLHYFEDAIREGCA
jgi:hypothetical protein